MSLRVPRYVVYYARYFGKDDPGNAPPLFGEVMEYGPVGQAGGSPIQYLKVRFDGLQDPLTIPFYYGDKPLKSNTLAISKEEYICNVIMES